MKLPRVRIGTLMLLVVIAALTVALVVERRRSDRVTRARMDDQRHEARMRAMFPPAPPAPGP